MYYKKRKGAVFENLYTAIIIALILFSIILIAGCVKQSVISEKVFTANEGDGTVSVIDAVSLMEINRISLDMEHDGVKLKFMPHNVQVVDDLVLVTANIASGEQEHGHDSGHSQSQEGHEHEDQLVIIDAKTNKILKRINLDIGAHLAHVVSDGRYAYVTSTNKEIIYKVDLNTNEVSRISLPNGSKPHGIRISEDGRLAVVAGMGKVLLLVDTVSSNVKSIKLPGIGVQAGIVNNLAMASIFDTKQLAIYNINTDKLSFVDLPDAKGPIQIYPSPDKKFVYIADQGVYFNQPESRYVYKVDLELKKVVEVIDSGKAPHGIVVSPDGRVWVTNLNGNSVTVIQNDRKVAEIPVGKAPNGITYWPI